ncbi:MAG: polyhydroxyalkanoate synthesis regulator DNA-binding domain-containing protein [Myxococcota bacterium]|nr:polyhydroxyalkanoate synthesis regulator DNA-binding domain-containing protein [Myxococcota bacterium]
MRLIRRYPNRKLYDVQNSRYVSLKALREMILSGESLKVVSTTDGRDLTRITIARLKLAEAEQAVRGLPETVANHLNQGVDGMMRRLQTLEQGIGQFRSTLVNPLAKMEEMTQQLDQLQKAVDALQNKLEELEASEQEKE